MQLLVFTLDGGRYGIGAREVREVVRAVAVSHLPGAPPVVLGVIGVRGALAPVFDLRRRFGLPPRGLDPSEHFVIADAAGRVVALRVDAVVGLAEVEDGALAAAREAVASASGAVAGVARLRDGMVVVADPAAFLLAAEAESLDGAMEAAARGGGAGG